MRTSNKILLILFLSAIGIFSAVHLALYARFSRGGIVTGKDIESGFKAFYNGAIPSTLLLKGDLKVSLLPSDSFSIEWEKSIDGQIKWRKAGDSLIVEGSGSGIIDPFDERRYQQFPTMTVYCGQLRHIQLSGCSARIDGTKQPALFAADLYLQEAQLRVGGFFYFHENIPSASSVEYYDSIRIRATHSNILIQQNANIRSLYLQLADRSRISDENARIARPEIHYSNDSWLGLSGEDLRKLK